MSAWKVVAKNPSGTPIELSTLGIVIPANGQEILVSNVGGEGQFSFTDVAQCDALRFYVESAALIINDGASDLSAVNGRALLTLIHQKYLFDNYYNKTEMNTGGGGAQIHWDNITGKPAYGQPDGWYRPVKFRVRGVGASTAPASPILGDAYVSNTAEYFVYDGSTWVSKGTASVGDRVIDLTDGDMSILEWSGTLWADTGVPTDAFAIVVDDDGDGKGAQYLYSSTTHDWSKIGDLDWANHFNGGSGKHDATEIDVEGIYPNIPGTPANLEVALAAIDVKLGLQDTNIDSVSLDRSYDKNGAGAGRIITVDSGAVKLDSSSATNAALELVPKAVRSTTGLAPGQLEVGTDGLLYVYDPIRSKWLSVTRPERVFGKKGLTGTIALAYYASDLPTTLSGLRLLRNATLTGISAQLTVSGSCTFNITVDDSSIVIVSLSLSSEMGNQRADLNYDLNAGQYLQCNCSAVTKVSDPLVILELAWRG